MNHLEKQASFSLAFVYGLRMLGLFMVLPVFSLYATKLDMARPELIGIALGIYGLTQALLQIPFGMLSDRYGRKPIIATGLFIFVIGSFFAGFSHNIYGVIVGRALQGAGAVGSAISALLADLTKEENRTKAMAIIGSVVGMAFMAAMVIGPIINAWITVSGIFFLSGILGVVGILVLLYWVPKPTILKFHREAETIPSLFKPILGDWELVKLDLGVLISHAILTATFIAVPITLQQSALLSEKAQGLFYLPILIVAFMGMIPLIITAEKKRKMRSLLILAVALIFLSELILWMFHSVLLMIALGLTIFFMAFSFLEASLPSLISKRAPVAAKGTAMGVYSTSQFFGMFLGGIFGGFLYAHSHHNAIYLGAAGLAFIWGIIAFAMEEPRYVSSFMVKVDCKNEEETEQLVSKMRNLAGIAEANIIFPENIVYLKYDKKLISEENIFACLHGDKQSLSP